MGDCACCLETERSPLIGGGSRWAGPSGEEAGEHEEEEDLKEDFFLEEEDEPLEAVEREEGDDAVTHTSLATVVGGSDSSLDVRYLRSSVHGRLMDTHPRFPCHG